MRRSVRPAYSSKDSVSSRSPARMGDTRSSFRPRARMGSRRNDHRAADRLQGEVARRSRSRATSRRISRSKSNPLQPRRGGRHGSRVLTSSVEKLGTAVIDRRFVARSPSRTSPNVVEALAGKTPGVSVNSQSGDPGAVVVHPDSRHQVALGRRAAAVRRRWRAGRQLDHDGRGSGGEASSRRIVRLTSTRTTSRPSRS